jgi:hypothetical protein
MSFFRVLPYAETRSRLTQTRSSSPENKNDNSSGLPMAGD